MTTNLTVSATFTKLNGQPATGLTLSDIKLFLTSQDKSTGVDTTVWDGTQVATVEINNVGMYTRILATADLTVNDYFAMAQYIGATVLDSSYAYGQVSMVEANTMQIESIDATDQIRDSILTDATPFAGANINAAITTRATPAQVNAEVNTALTDYDAPTSAELVLEINSVQADIAALNNLSAAQVNAEVVDALNVDTYAEPGSVPAATASLVAKIGWLMALARNKILQTATLQSLRNDGDSGNIGSSVVGDDGTTATRNKWS